MRGRLQKGEEEIKTKDKTRKEKETCGGDTGSENELKEERRIGEKEKERERDSSKWLVNHQVRFW